MVKQIEEKIGDKELMDKYIEIQSQITSIDCESKFIEGYKTAFKLIFSGIKWKKAEKRREKAEKILTYILKHAKINVYHK